MPNTASSKINIVEIKFHNLRLRVFALKSHRNKYFRDLALPGHFIAQKYRAGKLLRNRAAALVDFPPVFNQHDGCPDICKQIHAIMLQKFPILRADHRLHRIFRYIPILKIRE